MGVQPPRHRPGVRAAVQRLRPCARAPLRRAGRGVQGDDGHHAPAKLQGYGGTRARRRTGARNHRRRAPRGGAGGVRRRGARRKRARGQGVEKKARHEQTRRGVGNYPQRGADFGQRPPAGGEGGARPVRPPRRGGWATSVARRRGLLGQHRRRQPQGLPGTVLRPERAAENLRRLRGGHDQTGETPGQGLPGQFAAVGRRRAT